MKLHGPMPQPLLVTTALCSMRMQLPGLRSLHLTFPGAQGFFPASEPVKALGGFTQLKRLRINLSYPLVSNHDDSITPQDGLCPACCMLSVTLVSEQHCLHCQDCLSDSTHQSPCWHQAHLPSSKHVGAVGHGTSIILSLTSCGVELCNCRRWHLATMQQCSTSAA